MQRCPRFASILALLVVAASSSGCDPSTMSRINNDTDTVIELELTLDKEQWSHGFEPEEYQQWLSERTDDWIKEQLSKYASAGEGIELVAVDAPRLAGRFRMAPSALLTVHRGLGKGPYHDFSRLVVTRGDQTRTFSGSEVIRNLFRSAEDNSWEFKISDEF